MRAHPMNVALLHDVARGMLRRAADAWSKDAVATAERWTAAAWALLDGENFVDVDDKADR